MISHKRVFLRAIWFQSRGQYIVESKLNPLYNPYKWCPTESLESLLNKLWPKHQWKISHKRFLWHSKIVIFKSNISANRRDPIQRHFTWDTKVVLVTTLIAVGTKYKYKFKSGATDDVRNDHGSVVIQYSTAVSAQTNTHGRCYDITHPRVNTQIKTSQRSQIVSVLLFRTV